MPLTFYIGSSGAGKTHSLLTEMIRRSMEEPGKRFLVIVPEQSTMEVQKKLVLMHPRKCILNLEVVSLARLAHRVFAEVGFRGEALLEEIGKSFLIEKTVLENRKSLEYFGKNLSRPENIAELKAMISELMLYDVSPEELRQSETEGLLGAKIRDASLLYEAFRARLEDTYMTMEEVPDKMCDLVEKSDFLRGSVIAFDGFTGFTPVQLRLIEKLMAIASDVYLALTADPDTNLNALPNGTELFGMSLEMAGQFREMANRTGTKILKNVVIPQSRDSREAGSPELKHLEANLFRRRPRAFRAVMSVSDRAGSNGTGGACGNRASGNPDRSAASTPDIRLTAAKNPRAETEEAARLICRLVREEGMRYRDIAILTGDLASYGDYAREIMAEYDIPCFVDEKRAILMNPFIEYLRAAIEAVSEDYSYEGMFRMLKSGMTDFDREEVDHLENYIIGRGIRGKKRWRTDFIQSYQGEDPGEVPNLNQLRKEICELLDPLADAFSSRGSTVREKSEALLAFCARSRAEEKLTERSEHFHECGRDDLSREYAQIWPYLTSFLEKLISVLGEEKISMRDYAALLEAGFAEARVAIIPPGNDRILIGDVERSRIPEVRVLIFLGMNEGIVPKPPKSGGILTDLDRMKLEDKDVHLKPTARAKMYIDRFYLYLALTKPSEKLYLSYSLSNTSGEAQHPAYVIDLLRKMFPDLAPDLPKDTLEAKLERENVGISLLADGMRKIGLSEPENDYLELFSHYLHHPEYEERTKKLIAAASAKKRSDEIGRAAARALYGSELNISASRLERFCECEFRHFLDYGLRLKPRPSFEFNGGNFGSIIHRTLQFYADELVKRGLNETCDSEELHRIADQAFDAAIEEEGQESALQSSARAKSQTNRMRRILHHSVDVLAGAAEVGDFSFFMSEADFYGGKGLPGLEFELRDGTPLRLIGRIDRIDTAKNGDASYVRIIDYKTGSTKYDLAKIYYGLQLQLALYMQAALELLRKKGINPVPAGMLYFPAADPVIEYQDGEEDDARMSRRTKALGISGVICGEPSALKILDKSIARDGESDYYPIKMKKDGKPSAASKVFDASEFALVGHFAEKKAVDTGEKIMSGSALVNPYSFGADETACMYCPHRVVCGFDPRIPGFEFRELQKMKQCDIMAEMTKLLKENEEGKEEERDGNEMDR